jgi:16S rRNA (uracil1498-N3)-methyltransferase
VRRVFVEALPEGAAPVALDGRALHHLRTVLRLEAGAPLTLFDGEGREADGVLLADGRVEVGSARRRGPVGPTLLQALPKGSKLDDIVRRCTELGVGRIALAEAARSVVRLDGARGARRVERLTRIAREAARQSGAPVPRIDAPRPLGAWLEEAEGSRLLLVPGAPASLEEGLGADPAWLAVGPEGGFAPEERARARALGWIEVGLPFPVLRVETAGPVVVALATYLRRNR